MSECYELDTLLVRAGINSCKETGSLVTPIHFSTTYQHPEFGKSTGFDYTRTQNPTRLKLETALAQIENANFALATSSGMSAITLVFESFLDKKRVVTVRDLYGGTFRYFDYLEKASMFNFVYSRSEEELVSEIKKGADIVFLESPTNPLMQEYDIARISKISREQNAIFVVDNTFYTPIYQRPIELGADIVVHSATKYLAGHNDVLAGAVITNKLDIYEKLLYNLNTTGAVLSPFDSYLVIRGLKTLSIRMERSTSNSVKIAEFLKNSKYVKEIFYTGKAGTLSFKISDEQKIPVFINSLKVFTFAESLGGVESLITYPATQTHGDIPQKTRESYGLTNDLLRLSIGIESYKDLISDLKQAFDKAFSDN